MKIPMKSRWKTTVALAVTSVALMGPAYAQDNQTPAHASSPR